jgi:putative NADPH-quinone reductase
MKSILVISGHSDSNSLTASMARAYQEGAIESGADCSLLDLGAMTFDPILRFGYNKSIELEPDLVWAQDCISKADHIVIVFPVWWGTYPAILKGFIDRTFLPGFAFKYRHADDVYWDKLLKGKTAHVISSLDAPVHYYEDKYKKAGQVAIVDATLHYCGIKTTKETFYTPIRPTTFETRLAWLEEVRGFGREMV